MSKETFTPPPGEKTPENERNDDSKFKFLNGDLTPEEFKNYYRRLNNFRVDRLNRSEVYTPKVSKESPQGDNVTTDECSDFDDEKMKDLKNFDQVALVAASAINSLLEGLPGPANDEERKKYYKDCQDLVDAFRVVMKRRQS